MVHCEDKGLATGSMHEGTVSHALGLLGSPAEAEEIVMARDLALARLTGAGSMFAMFRSDAGRSWYGWRNRRASE
jgi:dihydroorotase-like cyclic amidohydrolase